MKYVLFFFSPAFKHIFPLLSPVNFFSVISSSSSPLKEHAVCILFEEENPPAKARPLLCSESPQDRLWVPIDKSLIPLWVCFCILARLAAELVVLGLISSEQSSSDLPTPACVWH